MAGHGLSIERRDLLIVGAGGLLALAAPGGAQPMADADFKALMAALEQIGDQLPLTTSPEQDAYVHRLASQAILAPGFPTPKTGPMGRSGVQIGPLGRTDPPTDAVHGIIRNSARGHGKST